MSGETADDRPQTASARAVAGEHEEQPASVIMLIRHGEKPTGTDHGVTFDGTANKKSLTVTGWARAGALLELFAPAVGPPRPGLLRPAALFASNRHGPGGGSNREHQTLQLLARGLDVAINLDHGVGEERQLLDAVATTAGPVLICWKHDYMAAIAAHLTAAEVPAAWPEDRYDLVWVFSRPASGGSSGYEFAQVPELLLPGDSSTPIS